MSEKISYSDYTSSDLVSLLEMGKKLWPDFSRDEIEQLVNKSEVSRKFRIIMAKHLPVENVGFAIFSIRTDYVEGSVKSPTGYLEGIYVKPSYRKQGIARAFLRMGEKWCKEKGCTQMGSDTWLTDQPSRAFHKKVGFWEEEEVVHFLKNIK